MIGTVSMCMICSPPTTCQERSDDCVGPSKVYLPISVTLGLSSRSDNCIRPMIAALMDKNTLVKAHYY